MTELPREDGFTVGSKVTGPSRDLNHQRIPVNVAWICGFLGCVNNTCIKWRVKLLILYSSYSNNYVTRSCKLNVHSVQTALKIKAKH
jgi:hypothetical protein